MSYKLLQEILYFKQMKPSFSEAENEALRTSFSKQLKSVQINSDPFEIEF